MNTARRVINVARARILLNVALFQLGWWACILLAAKDRTALATLSLVAIISIQILIDTSPARALRLALVCLLVGALIESILLALEVTAYRSTEVAWGLAPPWMIGLWPLLSTTLRVSLRGLLGHPLLGFVLGAVAGPLAYGAGARLGALELPANYSLWVIAAVWGAAFPGLVWLAGRQDRRRWVR